MNIENLEKDELLIHILKKIFQEPFGSKIEIEDHWSADLLATGLVSPKKRGFLVYLAVLHDNKGEYFISLEGPHDTKGFPYKKMDEFEKLNYREVLTKIREHLNL